MKCLADTHVLLWAFLDSRRLSENIRAILQNTGNEIFYSPINLWEISLKYGLKKLSLNGITPEGFHAVLEKSFFILKPVDPLTAATVHRLPRHHKDPFDRFLIWEAIRGGYTLLSVDAGLAAYRAEGLALER